MKIVTIIGARPQFIKAAAVSRAFGKVSGTEEVIVHTGQHYDSNMSEVFFKELEIPTPNYNLAIGSGPHGQQTGRMLEAIEKVLLETRPDWVLVYGDTNSTAAGAMAAVKLHIPVAHVEAGLRSFNRKMPEEINRIVTDHISEILFAPTDTAVKNLQAEGIAGEKTVMSGDVMYDVALYYGKRAQAKENLLDRLQLMPKEFVMATVHRAENTDDYERMHVILQGLSLVAKEMPVVFPVHPRSKLIIENDPLLKSACKGILMVEPVGYLEMVALERNAAVIVTDSGGVQKEAYFHRTPCVTLRDETEWIELVQTGWNRLCPPVGFHQIVDAVRSAKDSYGADVDLYGQGNAAEVIVKTLIAGTMIQ